MTGQALLRLFVSAMAAFAGVTPAQSVPTPAPAPAPQAPAKQPNAAPLYRRAVEDLQRAFADADGSPELPEEPERKDAEPRFSDPEWGTLVTKATLALEGFAQAARLPGCDFGPAPEPAEIGPLPILAPLHLLDTLTAARGWQRLAATPGQAVEDALTLLRHSRHIAELPSNIAAQTAIENERQGLALLQAIAPHLQRNVKVLERCRNELAEHTIHRADRRRFVATLIADAHRTMRAVAAIWQKNEGDRAADDAQRTFLREHGDAVVTRTLAIVEAWFVPFADAVEIDLSKAGADLTDKLVAVRAEHDFRSIRANLANWSVERGIESMASIFATFVVPPIEDVLTWEAAARAELAACRAGFETPATLPGK